MTREAAWRKTDWCPTSSSPKSREKTKHNGGPFEQSSTMRIFKGSTTSEHARFCNATTRSRHKCQEWRQTRPQTLAANGYRRVYRSDDLYTHGAALLADGVGLGKTVEVLATIPFVSYGFFHSRHKFHHNTDISNSFSRWEPILAYTILNYLAIAQDTGRRPTPCRCPLSGARSLGRRSSRLLSGPCRLHLLWDRKEIHGESQVHHDIG